MKKKFDHVKSFTLCWILAQYVLSTCTYIYSAICQESYWLKYLSLARHCCWFLVSVLYSSVCLVYICTTNCKQSQTRTTVFWIGEEKKNDSFGKVPLDPTPHECCYFDLIFWNIWDQSVMVARLAFWKHYMLLFHLCI